MGKRIIAQRRGNGSPTYKAHSHRWLADIRYRHFDDIEKNACIRGTIIDLLHSRGHSAPVALIQYETGERYYTLAPEGVRVNDIIECGSTASVKNGNTLPLKSIPDGTVIYNIEINPGDGGKLCRVAGASGRVISHFLGETIVELPSKKHKKLNPFCRATIGVIAGHGRKDKPWVKAGKIHHAMRARGKLYPRTSGVAMNAVDHPYGSGRGRQHAKIKSPSRFAPPGRKVGRIGARRSGRK